MFPRALDPERIYADGHDCVYLPRKQHETLHQVVQSLDWGTDPDGIFARLPLFLIGMNSAHQDNKFAKEEAINQASLDTCPPALIDAVRALLKDPEVMGDWIISLQPILKSISVWDGAEPLDWHWDGPAGARFFFLIYLNHNRGWISEDGGQIHVGKRRLVGNFLSVDSDAVQTLGSYDPAARTLVCCNNQNPQFVHKVTPLFSEIERTVLMIGFDMD